MEKELYGIIKSISQFGFYINEKECIKVIEKKYNCHYSLYQNVFIQRKKMYHLAYLVSNRLEFVSQVHNKFKFSTFYMLYET